MGGAFLGIKNRTCTSNVSCQSCYCMLKTDLHGMQLGIGWFAFGQLNRGDSQAPNVSLVVVTALLDDLW